MKKALVRRVVSLFLCFCMVIGFVPIIDAQAAEIKGGTFDPHTGYLELEFGYQLTQYVNINVYVRSPSDDGLKKEFVGSIVENYLLSGANDVKAWLPEDSPDTMVSPYTPATKTDGGLVKLSEDGIYQADKNFAGEDIEPVAMMKHTLIWDGSLNGIPIIGPNLDEDVFYLTDTGRCWDGDKYSVRDKVKSSFTQSYHSTTDIIRAAKAGTLPPRIMITTHPQRWTDNAAEWLLEWVMQNVKNFVKRWLIR